MKTQIVAVAVSLVAIWALFQLPKSIINQADKNKLSDERPLPSKILSENTTLSAEDARKIAKLRNLFYSAENAEKSCRFADSLAGVFILLQKHDSAAHYASQLVLLHTTVKSLQTAGDIYYQLYTLSTTPTVANQFAAKAQELYKKLLEAQPQNAEAKSNLAMTYVTSENPMQAVMLLREVLQQNPDFEPAIFNLGLLSMQSGQTDKAIERFNKIKEINPRNWKAQLYLAMALLEKEEHTMAESVLNNIVANAKEPEIVAQARELLGEKN